jgi:hypothetical protein
VTNPPALAKAEVSGGNGEEGATFYLFTLCFPDVQYCPLHNLLLKRSNRPLPITALLFSMQRLLREMQVQRGRIIVALQIFLNAYLQRHELGGEGRKESMQFHDLGRMILPPLRRDHGVLTD